MLALLRMKDIVISPPNVIYLCLSTCVEYNGGMADLTLSHQPPIHVHRGRHTGNKACKEKIPIIISKITWKKRCSEVIIMIHMCTQNKNGSMSTSPFFLNVDLVFRLSWATHQVNIWTSPVEKDFKWSYRNHPYFPMNENIISRFDSEGICCAPPPSIKLWYRWVWDVTSPWKHTIKRTCIQKWLKDRSRLILWKERSFMKTSSLMLSYNSGTMCLNVYFSTHLP